MTEPENDTDNKPRVVTGKLHRVQKGYAKTFVQEPPTPPAPVRRPARVALMLALAHKIQEAIDRGVICGPAEAARRLGLTRARVTQLLNLTLLVPQFQERLLFAESVDGVEPITERAIRAAGDTVSWKEQRRVLPVVSSGTIAATH
jgi:hypothetical protein